MKNDTSFGILSVSDTFLRLSSRGLAGVLPPAGQIFEKLQFLEILAILVNFLRLSSMGLAGVLPPAGQIFEK